MEPTDKRVPLITDKLVWLHFELNTGTATVAIKYLDYYTDACRVYYNTIVR